MSKKDNKVEADKSANTETDKLKDIASALKQVETKVAKKKEEPKQEPKEEPKEEPKKKPPKKEAPKKQPKKPYTHIDVFLQSAIPYFKMNNIQAAGFKSKMNGQHYQRDEEVFVKELKKYLDI